MISPSGNIWLYAARSIKRFGCPRMAPTVDLSCGDGCERGQRLNERCRFTSPGSMRFIATSSPRNVGLLILARRLVLFGLNNWIAEDTIRPDARDTEAEFNPSTATF